MSESLAVVMPGGLSATALTLPDGLTFDEWLALGQTLVVVERGHLWWLGDWWNAGHRRYGEMATDEGKRRVKEATGYTYQTARNAGMVAATFEIARRRANVTFTVHAELLALSSDEQDAWLDIAEREGLGQKELRRRVRRGLPAPASDVLVLPPDVDLRGGDFREVLADLPDGSVDAIITDPPYPREYLPLYEALAGLAARVLVPGGSLVCMVGQSYLPELLGSMTCHLRYHWTASYVAAGDHTVIWDRNVLCGWKPILWLTNGEYDGHQVFDVFRSDAPEKASHEWRQSETGMAGLVEHFTDPGAHVLDPFMGTGTTGVVCRALGRRFTGCEIDEETFAVAHQRLGELI